MEKVQEKLQECINKGSMNSFERISKILSGESSSTSQTEAVNDNQSMQIESSTIKPLLGKNPDRIPTKKKDVLNKSKIRGQRKGEKPSLRTSSKKRKSVR